MARHIRLQFPGARYHVINRGNYRNAIFATPDAARAFERTLDEAATLHHWRLHAYVIMHNHFHLALETPGPNLVTGMHWLGGTYANRFNRFRAERGHLFQGRYQALLVEDDAHMVRVINYIHRNPVKAGLVPNDRAADFRWSSLRRFVRGPRPDWLSPTTLLNHLGLSDSSAGWQAYLALLATIAGEPVNNEDPFTCGWAIGSPGWQSAVAAQHVVLATQNDIPAVELHAFRLARWKNELEAALAQTGKTEDDVTYDLKSAPWKVTLALRLRQSVGASHPWIARELNMGSPASVRAYLARLINKSRPDPVGVRP